MLKSQVLFFKREKIMEERNRRLQYLTAFAVSISSMALGVCSAWPTPVIPKLVSNETGVKFTEDEISWMMALNAPGFIAGSLTSRFIADIFGRRSTVLASALPFAVGSILSLSVINAWLLYITRFLWGIGTGMVGTVLPMYLAEISDKDIRGSLFLYTRVMFSLGSLLIMSLGPFFSYTVINLPLFVMTICYFFVCLWIPESPYYYFKIGRVEEAKAGLSRLKGVKNAEDLKEEILSIQLNIESEMKRSSNTKELFTGRQYRKAISIGAGLKIAQIMTGGITIQQYLGRIMQESKANITLATVIIAFGAVRFVVGFVSTVLVDRIGRRPLLTYSFLGNAIVLGTVGFYFFFQEVIKIDEKLLSLYGFIPFLSIILSNIITTLGYSSIIFVIPGEIYPMNVKAVALTSLNIFGGVLSFVTALGYQKVKDLSGLCGAFWVFSSVSLFGAIFTTVCVPETKGKSLEEIQEMLQGVSSRVGEGVQLKEVVLFHRNIKETDCLKEKEEEKESESL